jgi:hypothetical protein
MDTNQLDIRKLTTVEIKALCWDFSVQQNTINQQLSILTNELIRRQQESQPPQSS